MKLSYYILSKERFINCNGNSNTFFIMKNIDFATVTRLDLEIWDTQNKIKYIKLPTRKARKSECWFTQTKGVRTNTNRGRINTKSANLV